MRGLMLRQIKVKILTRGAARCPGRTVRGSRPSASPSVATIGPDLSILDRPGRAPATRPSIPLMITRRPTRRRTTLRAVNPADSGLSIHTTSVEIVSCGPSGVRFARSPSSSFSCRRPWVDSGCSRPGCGGRSRVTPYGRSPRAGHEREADDALPWPALLSPGRRCRTAPAALGVDHAASTFSPACFARAKETGPCRVSRVTP